MATDRGGLQGPSADHPGGDAQPLRVHTCGRIGMRANPPRALRGWLRRR